VVKHSFFFAILAIPIPKLVSHSVLAVTVSAQ
jgi:hypothetical protein